MKRGIVGDVIAGDRLAREGIKNRSRAGEIPGAFGQRRNAEEVSQRLPGSLAIVISEEKRAVFYDRAAHGSAELILPKGRSRSGQSEEIFRLEHVIANKFVRGTVQLVGSGLRDHVDHRARFPSELGAVVGLIDHEFGRVVRGGIEHDVVEIFVGDAHSIYQKQIVSSPLPENIDQRAGLL